MSVEEAQERISATEFAEWVAYARIEPFGYERTEAAIAIVGCRLAQVWGAKVKPEDFMLNFGPKKRKTESEMIMMLDILAGSMKG